MEGLQGKDSTVLADEIVDYWNERAQSYSNGVLGELGDHRADAWADELSSVVRAAWRADVGERPLRALDLGCGPGFFSVLLARMGCIVDAVDTSPEMIARARRNVSEAGMERRVTFAECDVAVLPFSDESFDVVVSRNITWLLREPERAYREWLRVLRPGGSMAIYDANWYRYLVDADLRARRAADQAANRLEDWSEDALATSAEERRCEEIALQLPFTSIVRPAWDIDFLGSLGVSRVEADEEAWRRLWTPSQQAFHASTPLFSICVVK